MKRTRQLLFFALYWTLYSNLLYRYTLLSEFRTFLSLVPDAIVVYLLFNHRNIISSWVRRRLLTTTLCLCYMGVFIMGAFNALLNQVSPMTVIWGLRLTVCFPICFFLVVNFCDYSDIDRFKRVMYTSFFVSVFFCVIQFLTGKEGDFLGGTFAGNGGLAMHSVLIAIITANDLFNHNINNRKFIIVLVCMFFIAIIGEIKYMYYAIPLSSLFVFLLSKKISVNNLLILGIASISLLPITQKVMSLYYDEEYIEDTFDAEKMDEYSTSAYAYQKGGFNRGTALELATTVILKDPVHVLFGYGLGSGSASTSFNGVLYEKYKYTTYHFFSTSYILVELGWVGLLTFALCLVLLILRYLRYYRKYSKNSYLKFWMVCGIVSAIMTFINAYYNQMPYIDYYMYYFLWGICFVAIKNEVFGSEQYRIIRKKKKIIR